MTLPRLETKKYATPQQFGLLKKLKRLGTPLEKGLTRDLWLNNRQALELGYDVPEGEDFLLSPLEEEELLGRIPPPEIAPVEEVPPEEVLPEVPEVESLLERLYPDRTPEETIQMLAGLEIVEVMPQGERIRAEQAQDAFLDDIIARGRTEDTEALLRGLEVDEETIDAIFAEVLPEITDEELIYREYLRTGGKLEVDAWRMAGTPLRPEGEREVTPIETGWKAVWNKLRTSASQFWFQTKDYFVTVLPQIMFPDKETIKRDLPGYPERLLEQKAAENRVMRDRFRELSVSNREQYEEWVKSHPELKPPPEWEGEILTLLKDKPTLILDPAFIGYITADSAAFMAAFWGATAAVGLATKNPIAGMAAGVAVTTPAQSQDLYEDLLWAGAKEQQAAQLAIPVGLLISSVEMIGGLAVLRAVGALPGMRPFYQLFRRNVQREVAKGLISTMAKRGLVSFTQIELAEIFEEIIQSAIQNALVKTFDESREILGGITETVLRTFISVMPLAIIGGGANVRLTYRQMTSEQRQQVEASQSQLEDAGIPPDEAEMIALTHFAETEEGQAVIDNVLEQVEEIPTIEPEVAPTPIVEPVVTPEVAAVEEVRINALERELIATLGREISFRNDLTWKQSMAYLEQGVPNLIIGTKGATESEVRFIAYHEWSHLIASTEGFQVLTPEQSQEIGGRLARDADAFLWAIEEFKRKGLSLAEVSLLIPEDIKVLSVIQEQLPKPPAVEEVRPVTPIEAPPVKPVAEVVPEEREFVREGGVPIDPNETIAKGIVDNTLFVKDIGAKERFRPVRKVFDKIGLYPLYKGIQKAEVELGEERAAFQKRLAEVNKLVAKDRRALVFRELENPGSIVGLTFDEKRAVNFFRERFDKWADTLMLPQEKRIKNYVTHIFEEDITQQLKEEHPLDPALARALDDKTPKTIFNPFLEERLGRKVGLLEDPFAAAGAYEARQLKVLYYEPFLKRISAIANDENTPPAIRRYLDDYTRRMTGEPAKIDQEINTSIRELADKVRGLPGGNAFADALSRGNVSGWAAYNMTSVLYTLWLGFKFTSAIRNLSQHTLIMGETGLVHFSNGIKLRFTTEGKAALAESLVLRSRKTAFLPGIDDSFANQWGDKFRETALWMFRKADEQNVSDAFLAGYSEAKALLPDANRSVWLERGDEVAADTQYLYTRMNSMAISQTAVGRVFSMLTTWTENWMELMTKWVSKRPSIVYQNYEKATGVKVTKVPWSQTYQSILLYMLIVMVGKWIKDETRFRAWEYTGVTSLKYMAGVAGGEFPGLEISGAVADFITGFITDDDRMFKSGWNQLKRAGYPGILKQLENVASGEKDWLTLFFYLESLNYQVRKLKDDWKKEWKPYEDLSDPLIRAKQYPTLNANTARKRWREENPLIEAQMFVTGQFTALSSEQARQEVLRLIEKHNIDPELIKGYEKVFGVDTVPELSKFQKRIGQLEKLVIGEEAEYFDMGSFAGEVHKAVNSQGRNKVREDGHPLAVELLNAEDLWQVYFDYEEAGARKLYRQSNTDVEAQLYLWGKIGSFENPESAKELLRLMAKYNIPPQAINAFQQDPSKYDELFTQKFELEQKNFELDTLYENYSNSESSLYIEDKEERQLARDKFKEENPDWVADQRRIEAIDNDATSEQIEKWADRGETIDEFGAGSSEARAWLLDNPEVHTWAIDNKLLTDDGSDWNEDIIRLNVELRGLEEGSERDVVERKIEAHSSGFTKIDDYVNYYTLEAKGFRRERYLAENPEFATEMKDIRGIEAPDYVPPVEYDDLIEKETRTPEEELRVNAYEKKVPFKHIDNYVDFYSLEKPDDYPDISFYEDDFFLMEHPDFYKEVYLNTLGNQRADFRLVPPTRVMLDKWIVYNKIEFNQAQRDQFRLDNPDLDEWAVSVGIWTRTMSEKRRRLGITPQERYEEDIAEIRAETERLKEEAEEKEKELVK